jgi:hypothetical protein
MGILIKIARVLTSQGLDIERMRTKWDNALSVKTVMFCSHMYCDKTDYIVSFDSNPSQNFKDKMSSLSLSELVDYNSQDHWSWQLWVIFLFSYNWYLHFMLTPLNTTVQKSYLVWMGHKRRGWLPLWPHVRIPVQWRQPPHCADHRAHGRDTHYLTMNLSISIQSQSCGALTVAKHWPNSGKQ